MASRLFGRFNFIGMGNYSRNIRIHPKVNVGGKYTYILNCFTVIL